MAYKAKENGSRKLYRLSILEASFRSLVVACYMYQVIA